MTHEDSLKLLDAACDFVDRMTDDEFLDYMLKNSPTLRNELSKLELEAEKNTGSDFESNENTFACDYFSIPENFSNSVTNTTKIFKRTEETEAFEWQMMTEAA